MRGNAPRQLKCPRCGFKAGRDVVAVLNLEKKYLTSKGPVPLAPMPSEPTPDRGSSATSEGVGEEKVPRCNK